ncbi:hypothetical protein CB1_000326001 [Camelus ferus]|nr:hypothetical protein CB1_000326001 [Camelus ferus]
METRKELESWESRIASLDFPNQPIKAPESVSTIITAESIFYKGVYYQIGDVVSVIDEQDGKPYYAQIRGFIQDQYCEKSAALTWLIPTLSSPRDQFDPASYIIVLAQKEVLKAAVGGTERLLDEDAKRAPVRNDFDPTSAVLDHQPLGQSLQNQGSVVMSVTAAGVSEMPGSGCDQRP